MKINFEVKGSQPDPYKVTFERVESQFRAYCTCNAGDNGTFCKHRVNIMDGSTENIVSHNISEVLTLQTLLNGTNLYKAFTEYKSAVAKLEAATKEKKKAVDMLTKEMYGR